MGILKNMWNGGKHLMKTAYNGTVNGIKKGYQWAKDNPETVGEIMSGVGKVATAFNPALGMALNVGGATLSGLSKKNSWGAKAAKSYNERSNNPYKLYHNQMGKPINHQTYENTSSSPTPYRKNTGGYYGAL